LESQHPFPVGSRVRHKIHLKDRAAENGTATVVEAIEDYSMPWKECHALYRVLIDEDYNTLFKGPRKSLWRCYQTILCEPAQPTLF